MAQHNITRILAGAAIAATAMLAAGCTQDDTLADGGAGAGALTPDAAQGIIISGSGTGGTGATRGYVGPDDATSGPQAEGVCRADAIDVMAFKDGRKQSTVGGNGGWPESAADLDVVQTFNPSLQTFGNDKYAKCTVTVNDVSSDGTNHYTYVQSTALAYKTEEKNLFKITTTNRANISLEIQKNADESYKTPELFYGIVKGNAATDDDKITTGGVYGWPYWFTNAFYWSYGDYDYGGPYKTRNITFTGRIFRIVSQLNMNITDIPVSGVKRIELYGDNYPFGIRLNGTYDDDNEKISYHGEFYPVTAAEESQTTGTAPESEGDWTTLPNYVLLDAKDIAEGDEEITLSSFLLPSTQGMRLKMRIEFSEDAVNLEDDDLIIKVEGEGQDAVTRYFKDYNIRPGQSYTIEDGADIYTTATQEQHYNNDQSSKDLYVYNNNEGKMCFYSYSNVRVTMSGKLEDIAGETGQSNIKIEVEPGFEKVHDIPLN